MENKWIIFQFGSTAPVIKSPKEVIKKRWFKLKIWEKTKNHAESIANPLKMFFN